ncbi:MAG: tetratricopeptide repeat protein [Bacteroidota bacterium]
MRTALLSLLSGLMLLCCLKSAGQTKAVDSLERLLTSAKGEAFFKTSNVLADTYLDFSPLNALEISEALLTDESIEAFPREAAMANYIIGRALSIQGKYGDSYPYFDKAISNFERLNLKEKAALSYLGKGIATAYHSRYDDAKQAFDRGLAIYNEIADESGVARAYHEIGHLQYLLRNHEEALRYYGLSIEINERLDQKKALSDDYFRRGIALHGNGDDINALESFTKSKAIKEEIGDLLGLSKVHISLGIFHEEEGNYDTARDYYQSSLDFNQQIADQRITAVILNNMGILYEDWGKYDSAVVYHKKSLDIRKSQNNQMGMVQSLANIGETYQLQENYAEGLKYFNEAYDISSASPQRPMYSYIIDKIGEVYLAMGRLDNAENYLQEALELRLAGDNYFALRRTYRNLSELSEKREDFAKSLEYYKQFTTVQDSFFQSRKNRELAEIQAKYDTERQQKEIISLQQENKNRTLWRNIFAVGTLITLGLVLLLFQFFLYRNKKNKELLAAEEAQREQLEEMNQLKSRFFGNISHEFRTPLTLILGPLDSLRKQADTSLSSKIDVIERNGKRLLKLINQLLDLSKIEAGRVKLKAALTDIVPLIKGWVMSFNSLADSHGIALKFHSDQPSHFLYVDREKMEEVIINLLSNALKYTSEGGVVSVEIREGEGSNHLNILVSDTGSGIPKEELEHIFDRFYQASNANNEDVTGTGIGLSLTKELVELHGGSISVESEIGKGSTFEISIPQGKDHLDAEEIVIIKPAKEQPVAVQREVALAEETNLADASQATSLPLILLVEDNQDLRSYVEEILSDTYKVLTARDGEEGLELAFEHTPDVVLSDLMMPKLDGIELCKRLKEDFRTSHIPVILLTAKASREDRLEGLKSEADDYLTKPFNTEELLVRLQNLVNIRKKLQAHFGSADGLLPKKVSLNSVDKVFMEKVTVLLEEQISNPLYGVSELSEGIGLSRSQLFRKVKAITGMTPNEFIRSFRLYRAMDLLKQRSANVSEVAYEVGFQNPSYFSKCFQEQFGQSPSSVSRD